MNSRHARVAVFAAVGLVLLAVGALPALAQSTESSPDNRFVLTGYGFTTYVDSDANGGSESFTTTFAPIVLYRINDKFLFETELEFELEEEGTETGVEYAQVDWLASDYLTVVIGKYLTPFGSFIERLHPAWINKLPTFPLTYQHGQSVVPFSQVGLQLRGGVPFGDGYRRFTYSVFASNGFQVSAHGHDEAAPIDEHGEAAPADEHAEDAIEEHADEADEHTEEALGGHDEDEELIFLAGSNSNANDDTAFGGRLSIVPARGLEIGASHLSGAYDEAGALNASATGFEFTFHRDLYGVRGEWLSSTIERGFAEDGDHLADQDVDSWYVQASLRLSIIPVYAFNKLELVARQANLDWGDGDRDQTTIGLNYYFTGSTVLRLAWERLDETGHDADNSVNAMFAIGF